MKLRRKRRGSERGLSSFGLLQQFGDKRRPARLVTGTQARASVAMKVLMEQQVVTEIGVGLKHLVRAKHRSVTMGITQKDVRQPARDLLCF